MLDKIHIMITILAAIFVTAAGLYTGVPAAQLAYFLVFVIVIFYFIGLIVKSYLKRNVFTEENVESEEDDGDNKKKNRRNRDEGGYDDLDDELDADFGDEADDDADHEADDGADEADSDDDRNG